jgi:hypothetical protein
LQPVREQHPVNEPAGRDGEAALVEGHERHQYPVGGRDTDSSAGTIHLTASVRGRSWPTSTRWRSCSWETLELVQFDITTAWSWAS